MALRLLIDECAMDNRLVSALTTAGHDVVTVNDAGLKRKPEHAVFEFAIDNQRLVITYNCADFVELADRKIADGGTHPGVLLVYLYNQPAKEMTYDQIVQAISNLEQTRLALQNAHHNLNNYKYDTLV